MPLCHSPSLASGNGTAWETSIALLDMVPSIVTHPAAIADLLRCMQRSDTGHWAFVRPLASGEVMENDSHACAHLPQVAHLSEMLRIDVICSVWHHDLRALPCKRIDDVPPQKPCAAKDCRNHSTDLHSANNHHWTALTIA